MIRHFKILVIGSVISLGLQPASNAQNLHSVKYDVRASKGLCVAPVEDTKQAKAILEANSVRIEKSANAEQIKSVAIGIQQIALLSNGPSQFIKGAYFTFPKRESYSSFNGSSIAMGANYRDGNVGHVMHELGHYVGGPGGLYGPYKSEIKERCLFTQYSNVSYSSDRYRNEEFAEVFAAFITNPDLLRKSSSASCVKGYEFFAHHFGAPKTLGVCSKTMMMEALKNRGAYLEQLSKKISTKVSIRSEQVKAANQVKGKTEGNLEPKKDSKKEAAQKFQAKEKAKVAQKKSQARSKKKSPIVFLRRV